LVDWAATTLALTVQIVAKLAGQTTFIVLPDAGAWSARSPGSTAAGAPCATPNGCPQHHATMIQWAMIALMTHRLAHHHTRNPYSPGSQGRTWG
jgi:hypothetical protein